MILEVFIFIFGLFISIEVILFLIVKLLPNFDVEEFPLITKKMLESYTSFDAELGWSRQANESKQEKNSSPITSWSTDALGSRTNPIIYLDNSKVSTYGDSFCFCREVNDNETWQFYLSDILRTKVTNYGVGNYGLDQSFLRSKRCFAKNSTETVIYAITPWTIMRISSMWKHFSEFGNTLALKPRYLLAQDKLSLIQMPVTEKDEFLALRKHLDFLKKNDQHYENYFKIHKTSFPRGLFFSKNAKLFYELVGTFITGILMKLKVYKIAPKVYLRSHYLRFIFELAYKKKLFEVNEILLKELCREIFSFSKSNNFRAALVLIPGWEDIIYRRNGNDFYEPCLRKIEKEIGLEFIDTYSVFEKIDRVESVFTVTKNRLPGHINSDGNKLIAKYLAEKLWN